MVSLVSGRWPDVGEALIAAGAAASYGLDGPIGAIETQSGEELAIVGTFQARDLFRSFAAGSLSPATDRHSMTTLIAVASTASESQALQSAVLQLIAPPDPQDLRVSSPATLADVQQSIGANLTQFSRSLLILVLMAGGVLTAIVVLADTLVRQRDLGRRRALGASRFSIVALVTARTALGATIGIVGGTSLAVVIARTSLPPTAFIAGVAVLAFFTATLSAAPPALLAAFRDPVTVLRTP